MRVNGEELEEVEQLNYVGSGIYAGGEMKVELRHRL